MNWIFLLVALICGAVFAAVVRIRTKRQSPSETPPEPRGTQTILLVDDERSVLRVAERILQAQGYRVLTAKSAEEGLEASRAEPGEIHLLLSDISLPKKTGRQLAEVLAAERPSLRVLFMSGYTDVPVLQQKALDERAPFLEKPFTPESLLSAVRQALS